MRASSAMKLISACCGGILLSMPVALVDANEKHYDDKRQEGVDKGFEGRNCVNALKDKTRYLQIEVFDYNKTPWIEATWTQISDECGGTNFTPYSESMSYNANDEDKREVPDNQRLQMDMYLCAPWGNYELEIVVKSTNGGDDMEKVAWEVEYGPDEYHTWDTLNTPFFKTANGADPSDFPYAPIPTKYTAGGEGTTYKWPLPGSEGYYSVLYSGPFPPLDSLDCPNLHPTDTDIEIEYFGCYGADDLGELGWEFAEDAFNGDDTGSRIPKKDPAEPYRMFDGLGGRGGVDEPGVMNIEICTELCAGYAFIGLHTGYKCLCGDVTEGPGTKKCGLRDGDVLPEYKYLCSGDSRVLCGTDTQVSVYSIDGSTSPIPPTTPAPTAPEPPSGYEYKGCSVDNVPPAGKRVMPLGPTILDILSAEICMDFCMNEDVEYNYFGMEYKVECFCAETLPDNVALNHNGCKDDCASNNGGEKCGGSYAISVYEIIDPTPSPTPTPVKPTPSPVKPTPTSVKPTPAPVDNSEPGDDHVSLGCYADAVSARIMGAIALVSSTMTTEACFEHCSSQGGTNTHFGTEYSVECFCGDDSQIDKHQDQAETPTCDMDCSGDADETCGGTNAMTVYKITDRPVDTPAPTPSGTSYDSLECYAENEGDMIMRLHKKSSSDINSKLCLGSCSEDDADTHVETQRGKECWCVDEPDLESVNPPNEITPGESV